MAGARRRVTQQDIARMTGVSQATVSLVLNGRADADVRIAPQTRDKVLRAIRETGYVADPVARRLASRHNRILGVFTYEPVFPSGSRDFYHPFLLGIEERAERVGSDLLLFTSAPVADDGRRRIFHDDHRLRLADGCILLGRQMNRDDLTRLVAEEYPFVAVGRRDDAGGPVPYVGADYPSATAALVKRAVSLGHGRLAYVGPGGGAESPADRMRGFTRAAADAGVFATHAPTADAETLDSLLRQGITALFVEEPADGVALVALAKERAVRVPADLSLVALGDPTRPTTTDLDFSGFSIPRKEMGEQAVEVLTGLIEGHEKTQRLLPCELIAGSTLAERKS